MIAVAAVTALHACGDDSNEVMTASTDARVSTTAAAASTTVDSTIDPTIAVVATPDETSPAATAPIPTCSTFYRVSASVPPDNGPVLTFTTPGDAEATFTDLHLTATYSGDRYFSPSLSIHVSTLPDQALLFASLYQFADPTVDPNVFASTGQGFTGLIYVYNPTSGSELQFYCSTD